jgi:hypothetical protein
MTAGPARVTGPMLLTWALGTALGIGLVYAATASWRRASPHTILTAPFDASIRGSSAIAGLLLLAWIAALFARRPWRVPVAFACAAAWTFWGCVVDGISV